MLSVWKATMPSGEPLSWELPMFPHTPYEELYNTGCASRCNVENSPTSLWAPKYVRSCRRFSPASLPFAPLCRGLLSEDFHCCQNAKKPRKRGFFD